ncbi:hypothetical protein [Flavobacterium columnare]|nr:hypothetical protein [Flavobacterium columnare]
MNSFLIRFNLTSKKEDANFLQKINYTVKLGLDSMEKQQIRKV